MDGCEESESPGGLKNVIENDIVPALMRRLDETKEGGEKAL